MSKYAKINKEGIVENIIVCDESNIGSLSGTYVKITESSRNAEVGYEYNSNAGKFISKKLWPSWILNEETLEYEAPVEKPLSGKYYWNEEGLEWVELISDLSEE